MKIKLLVIGKTDDRNLIALIDNYTNRLKHYIPFELVVIPDLKNRKTLSIPLQKDKEGKLILKQLQTSDNVILLDENGKEFNSNQFSAFLQKKMNSGFKQVVFVIGGPYGFSTDVYQRAKEKVGLSKMTFSHQMVRLFFVEQIYRGFTIINNEPYHHN